MTRSGIYVIFICIQYVILFVFTIHISLLSTYLQPVEDYRLVFESSFIKIILIIKRTYFRSRFTIVAFYILDSCEKLFFIKSLTCEICEISKFVELYLEFIDVCCSPCFVTNL